MTGTSHRAERADLAAILRDRGALDADAVRGLFARLSDAVGAAHDSGRVHGDLEPSRVMVWSSGVDGAPFTVDVRTGPALGGPGSGPPGPPGVAWRAPELVDGGTAHPTADVWSLGLIAFALLTGRPYWRAAAAPRRASTVPPGAPEQRATPVPPDAYGDLADEVRFGPLPPASDRAAELGAGSLLPLSFDAWFARCVHRDPAARFRDAREAGIAFETIMIPQERESSPLFPLPRGRRFPNSEAPGPRRVLLIDDDRTTLKLLGLSLRQGGYEVVTAGSGEEGLTAARHAIPALILLDFLLPDFDAPEVLRRLRADPATADVPVILLTGTELATHIAEGFRAGANDYLMKPVDVRLLHTRIETAITARSNARRAVRHEKLVADLEEARAEQEVTLSMLPATWSGWWAVGGVAPSGMVGGDLIALFTGEDGAHTAVVVDVAGHGAGAALVGASVRAALGLLLRRHSLVEALAALNEELIRGASRHACVAAVEVTGREVTIVNAGLPPVCVSRRGEPILQVSSSGVPPGLLPGQAYLSTSFVAEPGDRIAVVSDGLVEPFGFVDEVLPILRALGTLDPARWSGNEQPLDVEDLLRDQLAQLERPQPDDATLLLLQAGR